MKKILLIGTGGTISCREGKEGLEPSYDAKSVLNYAGDIDKLCSIDTAQILSIDSTNMQPEYWIEIVHYIEKNYDKYDGFVITHGTDTMAYTSAAISFMIQKVNKPIVITGAQKPIDAENTDGKRNLLDSIRFACEDVGGVFVVFNGVVINGSRAAKLRTKSYNAFESINYPCLAVIKGDNIKYNSNISKVKKHEKPVFFKALDTNVFLFKLIPGIRPEIIDYVKERYDALVIESYGNGGIPFDEKRNLLDKIKEMTSLGKIVVITTQCILEGSDLNVYQVGRKALESNIIPAYDMTTEAIVTKLMWVMGQTKDINEVKKFMATPINEEVVVNI